MLEVFQQENYRMTRRKTTPQMQSCPCNGTLLRQRRQLRGWTQEELAERSGFSVRLIAKAEADGAIHADTVEVLAKTLSTSELPLYPEDLVCDPKRLTLEFIKNLEVHKENVVDACRHFLSEDIVFTMSGDPKVLPFAGEHRGIEAMDRACRLFFATLEIRNTETLQVVAEGNEVVACFRMHGGIPGVDPDQSTLLIPSATLVVYRLTFAKGKLVQFEDEFEADRAERGLQIQREFLQKQTDRGPQRL